MSNLSQMIKNIFDIIFGRKQNQEPVEEKKSQEIIPNETESTETVNIVISDEKSTITEEPVELEENEKVRMDSHFLWLFDPGHGGLLNGKYVTPGKRAKHGDDWFYEGVFNRDIVKRICKLCDEEGVSYEIIAPGNKDLKLSVRTKRANILWSNYKSNKGKPPIYVSIHSNAAGNKTATGWEVWTSKGQTKSDKFAQIFFDEMEKMFPGYKFRSDKTDGDDDKESQFYVLKNTSGPALLTENFFFTTYDPDYIKILSTEEGRNKIALAHFNAIIECERGLTHLL